jgi:hypothetical protein
MHSKAGLWPEAALFLFTFFVVVPSIAAAIGYAAWKGKPKNFSRELYWTVFTGVGAVSLFLMAYAQRMHADVGTWKYPFQIECFSLGALLFGIAGGCMVGIFAYRRTPPPQEPLE